MQREAYAKAKPGKLTAATLLASMRPCLRSAALLAAFVPALGFSWTPGGPPAPSGPPAALGSESLYSKKCAAQLLRYQRDESPGNRSQQVVYDMDTVVEKIKVQSFDVKINAERVYQARQDIIVHIGHLAPHLNYEAFVNLLDNYYQVAGAAIGFIYPSRWFRWRESRLYFEAERYSHAALIANQVHTAVALYYEISHVKRILEILKTFHSQIDNVLKIVERRISLGEDRIDSATRLRVVHNFLDMDFRSILADFHKMLYDLGYALDEPIARWNDIDIQIAALPDLSHIPPENAKQLVPIVLEKSFEQQQFKYLISASKFGTYARYFDFSNPGSSDDGALGVGYLSNVRIGKSKTLQLINEREQSQTRMALAVHKAVEDYNAAIANYKDATAGLLEATATYQFRASKFEQGGEFQVNEFVEAINDILLFESQVLLSQHRFVLSRSLLERLLLKAPYYQNLLEFSPKAPLHRLSLLMRWENKKIARAIARGKLRLDEPAPQAARAHEREKGATAP